MSTVGSSEDEQLINILGTSIVGKNIIFYKFVMYKVTEDPMAHAMINLSK